MTIIGLEERLKKEYLRPESISVATCPGCGHGIIRGLIIKAFDELKIDKDSTLIAGGIGCTCSYISTAFNVDTLHTLHGRAIAFATGSKMFKPELTVIVIGGDGDIGDIGGNHLIHAARRNIDMTVILANNQLYGMTGGQVACTTPLNIRTMTTRQGNPYQPFDLPKLVKAAGATYAARFSVTQPYQFIDGFKKAIQIKGFSFIEVLSPCPPQFGRRNELGTPVDTFSYYMKKCISDKDAEKLSPEELEDKIILGEY